MLLGDPAGDRQAEPASGRRVGGLEPHEALEHTIPLRLRDAGSFVVDGPSYRWLFDHEASVRDMTIRGLSTVVFRLMLALEDVQTRPLEQRLAAFLVLHASSRGDVVLTQQAIADHLGTTREVVARLLARLARLRLLTRHRGRVAIPDPRKLDAWSRAGLDAGAG